LKKIFVGTWMLGDNLCKLYVNPESNCGASTTTPGVDTPYAVMIIGIKNERWDPVVGALVHEAFEYCATVGQHSYEFVRGFKFDTSTRIIVMNHQQFGEVSERCGFFLADVIDPLRKVWRAYHAAKSRRKLKK